MLVIGTMVRALVPPAMGQGLRTTKRGKAFNVPAGSLGVVRYHVNDTITMVHFSCDPAKDGCVGCKPSEIEAVSSMSVAREVLTKTFPQFVALDDTNLGDVEAVLCIIDRLETEHKASEWVADHAACKAGTADPSAMAEKWGARGGAFINYGTVSGRWSSQGGE